MFAANFWTAGTAQDLTSDGPVSVLVRPERKTVTVSPSDPTQLRSSVVLDLAQCGLTVVSADPGVSASATARASGSRPTPLNATAQPSPSTSP
ncbi:polysaccharide lyase beta-sandwich domain-containing protein [Streptomyces sp. NPDC002206]